MNSAIHDAMNLGEKLTGILRGQYDHDAIFEQLRAIRHIDKLVAPVTLAYGTLETLEFQRQTPEFFAAVQKAGKPAKLIVGSEYTHHEIKEPLASPYGLLGRAAFEMMGITPGVV